jgi:DNA-binding NarL/FixJ family response regulator
MKSGGGEAMQRTALEVQVRGGLASETQEDTDVEDLVRQLLEYAIEESAPSQSSPDNPGNQEVMLDVQVDGMRYTLTRSPPPPARSEVSLSPRESEIVRLVAKGHPNKTIAAVLDISPWTVATHLRRVFSKLGVSCRAEMVARVLKEGLLRSSK